MSKLATIFLFAHAIAKIAGNKKTPDSPGKYDREKKYAGLLEQEVGQDCNDTGYDFSGCAAPKKIGRVI